MLTIYKNLVNRKQLQTVIKQTFSRHCKSYEYKAIVQKQVALEFEKYKNLLSGNGIDLGCGTGFLSKVLNDKELIGIDISKNMAKEYTKNTGNICIVADIQDLPLKNSSFDFAVSSFALHWTNINDSFFEISRILKKDSYFIFSIPVEPSLEEFFLFVGKNFNFPLTQKVLKDLYFNRFKILEIYEKQFPIYFENGKEALMFFKQTGTAINKNAKTLKEKISNYKKLISYDKPIKTKFNILFVKAIKN
ncbi:MAG: methyltransferase type 11 [Hydrogenothermus sp.]|nr:MAG: methyltransferase type 11 [Hydrogenothermus sp.]